MSYVSKIRVAETDYSIRDSRLSDEDIASFVTDEDLGNLNFVSYPTFSISDSNMHLTMSSPDSESLSLFSLDADGHLKMTVN